MGPLRVYVDTSVLGGCFDDEFAGPSRAFFDEVSGGKIVPLLSATLLREVEDAPEEVRDLLESIQ